MVEKKSKKKKPKVRFSNNREIKKLKPGERNKPVDYSHKTLPGFMVRVGAKQKSWIVRYTIHGKLKSYTLPIPYPTFSLEEATIEYRRIRYEVDRGIDPLAAKQIKKSEPTIADIMEFYLQETPLLSKGQKESERISKKDILPIIGHIRASELKRFDIKQLHSKVVKRGAPVMANRIVELLRRAFNYAFEEEQIATNTFPSIKKIKAQEYSRDRILSNYEIAVIWRTTEQLRPNMRDIHKLLLLLGQRTRDICSMKISDIDAQKREWTVPAPPRAKNKSPNILPLPTLAWNLVYPRLSNEKWIFPSKHNTNRMGYLGEGHTKNTKDARNKIIEISGIEGWTGHDLRRTMRTLLARQGIQPHIAERVIGHNQNGVEGIYDRFAYLDEKLEALEKVEEFILNLL